MLRNNGKPSVSVIVPAWNSAANLERLLASLEAQTSRDFEVLVVDRHSADGTSSLCSRTGASYFDIDAGRSEARNYGASVARGDYLLFLDTDMELSPDVVALCLAGVDGFDALCLREKAVTGGNYWARARALERDSMFGTLFSESPRFIRRAAFDKVGGYDREMVGYEDLDLQAKLIESGFGVGWVNSMIYHHEEGIGLREYLAKRSLYSTTSGIYARKHRAFWKVLRSPVRRGKGLVGAIISSGNIGSIALVPGLFLMRSVEYLSSVGGGR